MKARLRRTAAFAALGRAMTLGSRRGPSLWERLWAIPRMVFATLRGRYDGFGRLTLMGAGMLYVISPIDLLPELFLGVFGLADDAVVVAWLAGAVLAETERFLEWERRRRVLIEGDVV